MKKYIIGDFHFSNAHPWSEKAFLDFIDWFDKLPVEPNSCLIQLGDVLDKNMVDGRTLGYATRFFKIASKKFRRVIITSGNHCQKTNRLKRNQQYVVEYLPYAFENIEVYTKETILKIDEHTKAVLLPFKKTFTASTTEEYYSNELPAEFYEGCDLLCGHMAIKEGFIDGIEVEKFKAKHIAFGHIHIRNGKYAQCYTGSIMPFKSDETSDLPRCIKVLNDNSSSMDEITLPEFVHYAKFDYAVGSVPEHKKDESPIWIYDVIGIKSKKMAQELLPDYNINATKLTETKIEDTMNSITEQMTTFSQNKLDCLKEMIKVKNLKLKRNTMALLTEVLS